MKHNTEKNIMDLNELIDRAFGANQAVAPTEMEKMAAAELEDRNTAIEIIARAAALNQESLDDVDFDQLPTDHLVKTASSILDEIGASQYQNDGEATLELSPRLQHVLANDPEAMAKFASMDPDHQHMMVCGDILGETAARSFLAAVNGQQAGGQVKQAGLSQEKLAALDADADQLAYQYLLEQGLIREEGAAGADHIEQYSDEDITIQLAQQKIAAFLNQR